MRMFNLHILPDSGEQASCEAVAHWQSIIQIDGVALPICSR